MSSYRNIDVALDEGVAVLSLHSDGGPLRQGEQAEGELLAALAEVETDGNARVVVLTGTGDRFADAVDIGPSGAWKAGRRQRSLLDFVDIRLPIVAAVNGPARALAEYALLCDLVVLDPAATFQDDRLVRAGVPPIDGAHAAWSLAVGPLRASYHLMTGKALSASEAFEAGAASEISSPGCALKRALAVARVLASAPRLTNSYAREALVQDRRRRLIDDVPLGVAFGRSVSLADDDGSAHVYDPDRYDQVRLERDASGVVTLIMHDAGGPWRFRSSTFRDIHLAYEEVAADPAARALIITGAGDGFVAEGDLDEVIPVLSHLTPTSFDYFFRNGGRTLFRQFHIEVPVVLALNGPARIHTEFFYGADIVLASETATLADTNHLSAGNAIGASGIAWEHLAGGPRARQLIFGFQELDAGAMKAAGLVNEVLSPDALMPRARELAAAFAKLPRGTARALRVALSADQRRAHAVDYSPSAGLLALSLLDRTVPASLVDPFREPGLRG